MQHFRVNIGHPLLGILWVEQIRVASMPSQHIIALSCLVSFAAADIALSRSVNSMSTGVHGKLSLDHGCTSSDTYGSNNCTLAWGDSATATIDYKVPTDLHSASKLLLDLKVSLLPLQATCDICGSPCKLTVRRGALPAATFSSSQPSDSSSALTISIGP